MPSTVKARLHVTFIPSYLSTIIQTSTDDGIVAGSPKGPDESFIHQSFVNHSSILRHVS